MDTIVKIQVKYKIMDSSTDRIKYISCGANIVNEKHMKEVYIIKCDHLQSTKIHYYLFIVNIMSASNEQVIL